MDGRVLRGEVAAEDRRVGMERGMGKAVEMAVESEEDLGLGISSRRREVVGKSFRAGISPGRIGRRNAIIVDRLDMLCVIA